MSEAYNVDVTREDMDIIKSRIDWVQNHEKRMIPVNI